MRYTLQQPLRPSLRSSIFPGGGRSPLSRLLELGNAMFLKRGYGIVPGASGIEAWEDYGTTGTRGTWFPGGAGVTQYAEFPVVGGTLERYRAQVFLPVAIDNNSAPQTLLGVTTDTYDGVRLGASTGVVVGEVVTILQEESGTGDDERTAVKNITLAAGMHDLEIVWNTSANRYDIIIDGVTQTVASSNDGHCGKLPLKTPRLGLSHTPSQQFHGVIVSSILTATSGEVYSYIPSGNKAADWAEEGTAGMWFDGVGTAVEADPSDFDPSADGQVVSFTSQDNETGSLGVIFGYRDEITELVQVTQQSATELRLVIRGSDNQLKDDIITVPSGAQIVGTLTYNGVAKTAALVTNHGTASVSGFGTLSASSMLNIGCLDTSSGKQGFFEGVIRDFDVNGTLLLGDGNQSSNWDGRPVVGSPNRAIKDDTTWREAADGVVAGSPVAAVTTLSGYRVAVDVTQAATAKQPADGGGFPVFDGSDASLLNSALPDAWDQPMVVGLIGTTDRIAAYERFLDGGPTGPGRLLLGTSGTKWQLYRGTTSVLSSPNATISQRVALVGVFDGASSSLFVDGVDVSASSTTGTDTITDLRVGGVYDEGNNLDGSVETVYAIHNPGDIAEARDAMIAYLASF